MRFRSIASGSNGNCIFVDTPKTHILIDAGISCKRICEGLKALSVAPESVAAILVTHEHIDHRAGLAIFARHYRVPIYGTGGTLREIAEKDLNGDIDPSLYRVIGRECEFTIGDFRIHTIATSHDSAESCAYRLEAEGKSVAVMTDLGCYDEHIVEALQGLNGLLLESNHDVRMLETGSYPYPLKRRILSDFGHLSNENAGRLLSRLLNQDLKFVFLGHLSEENNYPELALLSVRNEIDASDNSYRASDFDIRVADRYHSSEIVEI